MYKAKIYTKNQNMSQLCTLADAYFGDYVFHGGDQNVMFQFEKDTTEKSMQYAVEDFVADVKELNGKVEYILEKGLI
jgi:hypothetical protein